MHEIIEKVKKMSRLINVLKYLFLSIGILLLFFFVYGIVKVNNKGRYYSEDVVLYEYEDGCNVYAYDSIPKEVINRFHTSIYDSNYSDKKLAYSFENSNYHYTYFYREDRRENEKYCVVQLYNNIMTQGYLWLDESGNICRMEKMLSVDELKHVSNRILLADTLALTKARENGMPIDANIKYSGLIYISNDGKVLSCYEIIYGNYEIIYINTETGEREYAGVTVSGSASREDASDIVIHFKGGIILYNFVSWIYEGVYEHLGSPF